jgi:hypothetical protein
MRIAVLSDTHNDVGNTRQALRRVRDEGIDTVIHCGDWTRPIIAEQFNDLHVIGVGGNMDGDPAALELQLRTLGNENWFGATYEGEIGGAWIGVTHGHRHGEIERLARGGRCAYVFHGHTHRRRDERQGRTRIINPGALGGTRHEPRGFCIVNLASGNVEFVEVASR